MLLFPTYYMLNLAKNETWLLRCTRKYIAEVIKPSTYLKFTWKY